MLDTQKPVIGDFVYFLPGLKASGVKRGVSYLFRGNIQTAQLLWQLSYCTEENKDAQYLRHHA